MNKKISILGSGIIGLCSGYHLLKKGYEVTFYDRDEPGNGASYGNAGSFSDYGAVPLNQPSIIKSLPKYLFSSFSPLSIKFNYLHKILPWTFQFLKNCNQRSMRNTAEKMNDLLVFSIAEYKKIFKDIGAEDLVEQKGALYIYGRDSKEKVNESNLLREALKIKQHLLTKYEVHDLEPNLNPIYEGGIYFPNSLHARNPKKISDKIFFKCLEMGATFVKDEILTIQKNKIKSKNKEYNFDHLLITAGAFSKKFTDQLGETIPLETERGYHVHFKDSDAILKRPVCSLDNWIYLTPMEQGLRAAGTVEFGGLQNPPSPKRIQYVTQEAKKMLSNLPDPCDSWMGFRPTLPDFIPVIGESKHYENIFYAFGHHHLGWTLGAITGSIIAKLISKDGVNLNFSKYRSTRFS
jgi:glycine/D-amino acid oxidase-like deaminating enzyme